MSSCSPWLCHDFTVSRERAVSFVGHWRRSSALVFFNKTCEPHCRVFDEHPLARNPPFSRR